MIGRKPFQHNALSNVLRAGTLSRADLERFAASGRLVDFTPVIRNIGGTDLLSGATYQAEGKYMRHDNVAIIWFRFWISVAVITGGTWYVDVSVPLSGLFTGEFVHVPQPIGRWYGQRGSSTLVTASGDLMAHSTDVTPAGYAVPTYIDAVPTGAIQFLSSTSPFTWQTDAIFAGWMTCQVNDGFHPSE